MKICNNSYLCFRELLTLLCEIELFGENVVQKFNCRSYIFLRKLGTNILARKGTKQKTFVITHESYFMVIYNLFVNCFKIS